MSPSLKRWLPWLALAAVIVGFANFLWLLVETAQLGGDALNGFVRNGHYFVASHGAATEVNEATWQWSRVHAASVFVTHPLMLIGVAYLLLTQAFPLMVGGSHTGSGGETETAFDQTTPLATTRTGGRIGDLRLTRPLVSVQVFAGGLVIKPAFMRAMAIRSEDIFAVRPTRIWGTEALTVELDDPQAPPQVDLYLTEDDPVTLAVQSLVLGRAAGPRRRRVERRTSATLWGASPVVMRVALLLGYLGSLVFIYLAATSFGPKLDGFGMIWWILAVCVTLYNTYYFFIRRRPRP